MSHDTLHPEPTFHEGEVAAQREVGVAERMARIGPQVFRAELPEQHRAFFPLLPFSIVGSVSAEGDPSASLVVGEPGFVWSPSPTSLRIDARPLAGDPLERALQPGASIGLLGIQPHTRRRNRANGSVTSRDATGVTLHIEQSFGNCPKYIHPRRIEYAGAELRRAPPAVRTAGALDAKTRASIAAADTFFIASSHPGAGRSLPGAPRSHGTDVSHRGGPRGFVVFTSDDTFIIPDYPGNNFYNTLGNLRLHPTAGLLFIDWASGDVLQVSAHAEAAPGAHPFAVPGSPARIVRFTVQGVRVFPEASQLEVVAD